MRKWRKEKKEKEGILKNEREREKERKREREGEKERNRDTEKQRKREKERGPLSASEVKRGFSFEVLGVHRRRATRQHTQNLGRECGEYVCVCVRVCVCLSGGFCIYVNV